MVGGGRTRYELLALLLVSAGALLALSPLLAPLRTLLLGAASIPHETFSALQLGGAYVFAVGLSLIAQRVVDYYLLLEKTEQLLSRALSILILLALALRLPWSLWAIPACYITAMANLFGAYQTRGRASLFLVIGLSLGALSLYSAKMLLLIPLLWLVMYQQRTLSFRHFLALLHGVVLAALGTFAICGVERSLELGQRWPAQWGQWHAVPWGMEGYPLVAWLACVLLGGLTLLLIGYVSAAWRSSVRQSTQMQSLGTMLVFGFVLWCFDSTCPMLFAALVHFPFVILLGRAVMLLPRLRYQRWAVGLLMLTLFVILLLS